MRASPYPARRSCKDITGIMCAPRPTRCTHPCAFRYETTRERMPADEWIRIAGVLSAPEANGQELALALLRSRDEPETSRLRGGLRSDRCSARGSLASRLGTGTRHRTDVSPRAAATDRSLCA